MENAAWFLADAVASGLEQHLETAAAAHEARTACRVAFEDDDHPAQTFLIDGLDDRPADGDLVSLAHRRREPERAAETERRAALRHPCSRKSEHEGYDVLAGCDALAKT